MFTGAEDYPDSLESNEIVFAQPFRIFSPHQDAATNIIQYQLENMTRKLLHPHRISDELRMKQTH